MADQEDIKANWTIVLAFLARDSNKTASTNEAIECAAAALLSRQSGRVLAALEAEQGFTGGYGHLVRAAKKTCNKTDLKGEPGRSLRADSFCVLAILGTTDPAIAAEFISSAIYLRSSHFRQHMLRCGMRLAHDSDGEALSDAVIACSCAPSAFDRWEAVGMVGSCKLRAEKLGDAQQDLTEYVMIAFDHAGPVASLLSPTDQARAISAAYQLSQLCLDAGEFGDAERTLIEAEQREEDLLSRAPSARVDEAAKEAARRTRKELAVVKRAGRWRRLTTFSMKGLAQAATEERKMHRRVIAVVHPCSGVGSEHTALTKSAA